MRWKKLMSDNSPIGPGTRVQLTFSLSLESGDEIDSTGDKPAEFVVGDGKLLPGFETVLNLPHFFHFFDNFFIANTLLDIFTSF